jgi:glycosyltransferase involved in cell wall biosynthesis
LVVSAHTGATVEPQITGTGVPRLSVVTPTYTRPTEVADLLANLATQRLLPDEVILVDGSDPGDPRTERVVDARRADLPFTIRYVRSTGGAALQRNVGIDLAAGDFIAFIDDDVRLDPAFFYEILTAFEHDHAGGVGCIAGCLTNPSRRIRRWLRLVLHRLLGGRTTIRPGAFDYGSGHPVPRAVGDPGSGLRDVDVVGAGCAIWRRAVFDDGLRFSPFFRTFSSNEDFHLALKAGGQWQIYDLGTARFAHLEAAAGRPSPFEESAHRVINSRFLFVDVVRHRTRAQERRFWLVLAVDLLLRLLVAICSFTRKRWGEAAGHASGMWRAYRHWPGTEATSSPNDRSDEI